MGFFIKLLCFEKGFNNDEISNKNFELVYKLTSIFDSFKNMELSKHTITLISKFFDDLTELSNTLNWKKKKIGKLKIFSQR